MPACAFCSTAIRMVPTIRCSSGLRFCGNFSVTGVFADPHDRVQIVLRAGAMGFMWGRRCCAFRARAVVGPDRIVGYRPMANGSY